MKKIILIVLMFALSSCVIYAPPPADKTISERGKELEERFDGYWWSTASQDQRLRYVQGFIDGYGNALKSVTSFLLEALISTSEISQEEAQLMRVKIFLWEPYDHSFQYYLKRVDNYYDTTQKMDTLIKDVMIKLSTPLE